MRQLRFLAFAVISFVAALLGALLSPSTWLHKALAVALCGVLSANPALCTNNAIAVHSQEASATNPVKAETTQFSDLLVQRSRDFDDDTPKSPLRPNLNNPKPPSFPNEVSPNTPVRRPDFDEAPNQQTNVTDRISFFNRLYRQITSDTFEIEFSSNKGCKFVISIRKKGDEIYQESIKFTSPSAEICGLSGFTAFASPDGNQMDIKIDNSSDYITIQRIDENNLKATLKNVSGTRELGVFPVQQSKGLNKDNSKIFNSFKEKNIITEAGCTAARRNCAGIAAMAGVAGALALIPNPLSSPILATISLGASLFGVGCWFMFGGAIPFPPALSKKVLEPLYGETLGNLPGSLYSLTSGLRGLSEESELARRRGEADGIRNPIPEAGKVSSAERFVDKGLAEIRKNLGIDYCDKESIPSKENDLFLPTNKLASTSLYNNSSCVCKFHINSPFINTNEFTSGDGSAGGKVRIISKLDPIESMDVYLPLMTFNLPSMPCNTPLAEVVDKYIKGKDFDPFQGKRGKIINGEVVGNVVMITAYLNKSNGSCNRENVMTMKFNKRLQRYQQFNR